MINKYHYVFIISFLSVCVTLVSCQTKKTPQQISEHFWLGMKTENEALVRKYSLSSSIDETEDITQFKSITKITLGKIIIDGDVAEIETTVTVSSNNKIMDVKLNTYLENNNDIWKVNYRKTVLQLKLNRNMAEVFSDIEEITEEVTEQIEKSVKEIKEKVVPEIKSEIEQAEQELLEKLPELKNVFDKFLEELEKSLEELIPAEKEEEAKTLKT